MGGPAVPLVIAGGFLGALGQSRADKAQARAERENGKFLLEQEALAKESTRRELEIFDYESEQLSASQMSAFAKAGVDVSGSPLAVMAETKLQQAREKNAIEVEGAFNARLARLRADASFKAAKDLENTSGMRMLGSLLTAGASAIAIGQKGK